MWQECFDPTFDDCTWTEGWARVPIIQPIPGEYDQFSVRSWRIDSADVCGRRIALNQELEVRGLILGDGRLWMSDVPQERLMMFNNAQASRGRVLVGGLGLGLYAQCALSTVDALWIVERNAPLIALVEPLVRIAADSHDVPFEVLYADVVEMLRGEPATLYDTIFLDTWDTLDAALLPRVNALRNLAVRHLAPGGRILLWGYAWMLRLFQQACERLLRIDPEERTAWLRVMTRQRPAVWRMLLPVAEHFAGQPADTLAGALRWCRSYALDVAEL